jgi:hypothetical protein
MSEDKMTMDKSHDDLRAEVDAASAIWGREVVMRKLCEDQDWFGLKTYKLVDDPKLSSQERWRRRSIIERQEACAPGFLKGFLAEDNLDQVRARLVRLLEARSRESS